MGLSKVDLWYRRLILTKFYTRGWGKPEDMRDILKMQKLISNRDVCWKLVSPDYPVTISGMTSLKNCTLVHGHFITPLMDVMPRLVPPAAKLARFEVVLPKNHLPGQDTQNNEINPACIHMAGTGDHGYHRRRELIAKPLLQSGIISVLLENPFYGTRKPKEQWRSGLLHVNDLFVMGGCLILETLVLLHWLKRMGYGPLGLTGISMGGHMASLAATNWPEAIALIPCMSWTSASVVWTEGVLSKSIPWRVLESQYSKDPKYEMEVMKLLNQVDSYQFGKNFISEDKCKNADKPFTGVLPKSTLKLVENSSKRKATETHRQKETIRFMKGVMDEITHLGNYTMPVDPTAVTFVVAKDDAYFPQSRLEHMQDVWPGCEVRVINTGHIAGCLIHHHVFRRAITDTFSRLTKERRLALHKDQTPPSDDGESVDTDKASQHQGELFRQSSPVPIFTVLRSFFSKA